MCLDASLEYNTEFYFKQKTSAVHEPGTEKSNRFASALLKIDRNAEQVYA